MTCDKLIHRERIKKEARAIAAADPSTTSVTLRTMAWNVLTGQPPLVRCRGRHEMAANDVECPDCEGEGSVDYTCGTCAGSGEGMVSDGPPCRSCKGQGGGWDACERCDGAGTIEDEAE